MVKTVFVTVGTTTFDPLIKTTSSEEICKLVKSLGYSRLVLQTGSINFPIQCWDMDDFTVSHYDYKNSIRDDIDAASLVISHAGAGSVLDVLGAGKPLLVVINEELQGNHQLELADKLSHDGHLYYCTCRSLADTLRSREFSSLKPFKPGNPHKFANFLDSVMGFS